MANYTVSDIITHATAGDAIQVSAVEPNAEVLLDVGPYRILLTEKHVTYALSGNKNIDPRTESTADTRLLDLGTIVTANQVLDSVSLRRAVTAGTVVATAGTVALSRTAVV